MTPFLKIVAEDIYNRFNGKLEDVAVVFPNKRASLFFSEYLLAKNNGKAMWSPRYMTIGELFQQNSKLTVGDQILLVSKLYKEYVRPRRTDESIEDYEKIRILRAKYADKKEVLAPLEKKLKEMAGMKLTDTNLPWHRTLQEAKALLYSISKELAE